MNDGVTVREFARQIGKSHVWVLKLIKEEALPRYTDGTIPLEAGLKAYDVYLETPKNKRGRPTNSSKKEKVSKRPAERVQPAKKEHSPPPVQEPVISDTQIEDLEPVNEPEPEALTPKASRTKEAVNINTAMNKAKLAETTFKARLREIEYKMKSGELLPKDEVAKEAQWLAEQVKSKLMAIPPRISSMCEGRVAREIEEIITDAINNALKELQKCKYTGEQG